MEQTLPQVLMREDNDLESKELSIVIISWNTSDLLQKALASIYATIEEISHEIIVVDNASTDDSVASVKREFPAVQLVENRRNRGFAAANNQAIRLAQGDYVLLLNSDTEVYPDALQRMLSYLKQHPRVAAVGPKLLNPDGSLQRSCHPFHTPSRELWRMISAETIFPKAEYRMQQWDAQQSQSVDVLMGACMLLRRTALDQVQLFDESFFFYSEEVDLCYRLYQAGWALHWLPTAQVLHYGGQSSNQIRLKTFRNLYSGKLRYFRKHYGQLAGWYYKVIMLVTTLPRVLLMPLLALLRPKQRAYYASLSSCYFHLLTDLPSM